MENFRTRKHRRKDYSQNYLRDSRLVRSLVEKADINPDDLVVEIGPGAGIITWELAKKADKVIALEIDTEIAQNLKDSLNLDNVEIYDRDFLNFNLKVLGRYKFFSNIPFASTAAIVRKLLLGNNPPINAYIIMQKEAAAKLMGDPEFSTTQASCLLKAFYTMRIVYNFRKTDFKPHPGVDTVLVKFETLSKPKILPHEKKTFKQFIFYIFNSNRPTLAKSLSKLTTDSQLHKISKEYKIDLNNNLSQCKFKDILQVFIYLLKNNPNVKYEIEALTEEILLRQKNLRTWYDVEIFN